MIRAALLAALLLAAPAMAQKPPSSGPAQPPPAFEPELPASDLLLRYEAPTLSWRWSLPAEASLEPALVRLMRSEALQSREKAIADSANAVPAGQPAFQTEWIETWKLEAETPLLMALSTRHYDFTGGAHGNVAMRGTIWDRSAGRRIGFADLFDDSQGALATLKPAFCKALDAERAARRQGQANNMFSDCPDPAAFPIVPVGNDRVQTFRVLVPPYVAGPWSEGVYEIDIDSKPLIPFLAAKFRPDFTNR